MVLLVAATAYLVGLQPALVVALIGWVCGRLRHLLAADRDRRLQAFRDNWSRRFHRDLFGMALSTSERDKYRKPPTHLLADQMRLADLPPS